MAQRLALLSAAQALKICLPLLKDNELTKLFENVERFAYDDEYAALLRERARGWLARLEPVSTEV
jgi:hypothetical protein